MVCFFRALVALRCSGRLGANLGDIGHPTDASPPPEGTSVARSVVLRLGLQHAGVCALRCTEGGVTPPCAPRRLPRCLRIISLPWISLLAMLRPSLAPPLLPLAPPLLRL